MLLADYKTARLHNLRFGSFTDQKNYVSDEIGISFGLKYKRKYRRNICVHLLTVACITNERLTAL